MEKDRTIIVIVLCILVILVYFQFFGQKPKPQPARPPAQPAAQPQPVTPAQPAQPVKAPPELVAPTQPEVPAQPEVPPQQGTVQTAALKLDWRNSAAAFSSVTLAARSEERYVYPDHLRVSPLRLLYSEDGEDYALRLCKADSIDDIAAGNWKILKSDSSELAMQATVPGGVIITKRFTFVEDSYHVLFELKLRNDTASAARMSYRLLVANGIVEEISKRVPGGSVVAQRIEGNLKVSRDKPTALTDEEPSKEYTAGGAWAGLENMYFAVVVAPENKMTAGAIRSIIVERAFEPTGKSQEPRGWGCQLNPESQPPEKSQVPEPDKPELMNMRVLLVSSEIPLEPGQEIVHNYLFFAGPKQDDVLGEYEGFGFSNLLDYGWFGALSKVFLLILRGIHYVIPNWGIAIIILTLIVRACLHPVSRKSQMTMQKYQRAMQKLKPKLDKLKDKHKNSKDKLTKETMKLYKEEGVSMFPAGGCLLMLLQIPVFIGLYWALSLSIELRQASFFWWINDLSQSDCAFRLSSNIPLLGTPCINVLPMFMLAAMIFQQLTQPRAADPQQAQQQKMTMYIMLFVIGFIFYSMPSGLVLYFLTSTMVGIGETKLIKRKLAAETNGT